MAKITEQEAKEARVKRDVFQMWADVMQSIWDSSITSFKDSKGDMRIFPKQGTNEILIGKRFRIYAEMINNSYIQVCLDEGQNENEYHVRLLEIRHVDNIDAICACILLIVFDTLKR